MLAEKIKDTMKNNHDSENKKYIVHLPVEKYTPTYYNLCCSLREKPYLKTFLSIYLFDLGIMNNYLVSSGFYRFKNSQLYITTTKSEQMKVLRDFPDIVGLEIN